MLTIKESARMRNSEMSEELVPDRILELGVAYWGSKALLSAVVLGLFSALAQGPLEAEVLRERLGLAPRSARDFFDALAALGRFAEGRPVKSNVQQDMREAHQRNIIAHHYCRRIP